LETTNKILVLDNLDPDAKWTGPWSFKLNEITRIDFGGGYERALAATAPKRRPKVLRQYGHNLLEQRPPKTLIKSLRALRGLELHRVEQPKLN
jgi:hypothetical protein